MINNRDLLWRTSSYGSGEQVRPSIYLLASLCPRKDDGVASFSFKDWEPWDLAASGRGIWLSHFKQRENDFSCVSIPSQTNRVYYAPFSSEHDPPFSLFWFRHNLLQKHPHRHTPKQNTSPCSGPSSAQPRWLLKWTTTMAFPFLR